MQNWYKKSLIKSAQRMSDIMISQNMPENLRPAYFDKVKLVDSLVLEYANLLYKPDSENISSPKTQSLLDKIHKEEAELEEMRKEPRRIMQEQAAKSKAEDEKAKQTTQRRYKNIHKIGPKLETLARDEFNLTDDPYLAGYMLANGDMLQFSYQGYQRDIDHRQVLEAFPDNFPIDSGSDGMNQFMIATGAIRMHLSRDFASFDLKSPPSYEQIKKLLNIIQESNLNEINLNINGEQFKFNDPSQQIDKIEKILQKA